MTVEERLEKIESLLVALVERRRSRTSTKSRSSPGSSANPASLAGNGAASVVSGLRRSCQGVGPMPAG